MSTRRLALEGTYLVVIALLAVLGWTDSRWAEIAVLLLCLPGVVAALPFLYVGVAAAWNASGGGSACTDACTSMGSHPFDHQGTPWAVPAVAALALVGAGVANVRLLRRIQRLRLRLPERRAYR